MDELFTVRVPFPGGGCQIYEVTAETAEEARVLVSTDAGALLGPAGLLAHIGCDLVLIENNAGDGVSFDEAEPMEAWVAERSEQQPIDG